MKIVEVQRFSILVRPVKDQSLISAAGTSQTIIVRIQTDLGLTGLGEAAADSTEAGRTHSALRDWLKAYGAALIGVDPRNINLVHGLLDQVGGRQAFGSHAARAAIDMAVHDIIGKARGCPVYELLGGAYRTELELLADITRASVPASAAHTAAERGYRGVKMRIGGGQHLASQAHFERKSRELVAVLEAVGEDLYVDADAGQSLGNPALVRTLLDKILSGRFRPNLSLQQPLHHLDLKGHALLRETLPIPIILDDAITSPEAVAQIVRIGAADRIVLGLERVGGLRNAMRIADICEAAAIGVSPASGSYTTIGDAAHCHLAAALHDPYPIRVGGHGTFVEMPIIGGPEINGGRAVLSDRPGLGVELDENALQSMRTAD
jgi:L-alanine-DL-glutamate epimerase-like enolase superfamily enzyme